MRALAPPFTSSPGAARALFRDHVLDRLGLRAKFIGRAFLNMPPAAVYRISPRAASWHRTSEKDADRRLAKRTGPQSMRVFCGCSIAARDYLQRAEALAGFCCYNYCCMHSQTGRERGFATTLKPALPAPRC